MMKSLPLEVRTVYLPRVGRLMLISRWSFLKREFFIRVMELRGCRYQEVYNPHEGTLLLMQR